MLIRGNHVNVTPRKDGGPKVMKEENMRVTETYIPESDELKLEINDLANPEFRLIVQIPFSTILQLREKQKEE